MRCTLVTASRSNARIICDEMQLGRLLNACSRQVRACSMLIIMNGDVTAPLPAVT